VAAVLSMRLLRRER